MKAILSTLADLIILAACAWAVNIVAGSPVVTAGVFTTWIAITALFKANDNRSEGEDS